MDEKGVVQLYRIKFRYSSECELCRADGVKLAPSERVVAVSRYGKDVGEVLGQVNSPGDIDTGSISSIIRVASDQDIAQYERNIRREQEALRLCSERVAARGLQMKLIRAHYLPEESKLLFFFTADGRVDFRELVKDLVAVFRTRIELRQIGVRDESRVLGGMAVCGRTYCCHGVSDRLRPVSIKMAKEQELSLNSTKISGPCGRLLCCLAYEYDFYHEERRRFPAVGVSVMGPQESYRVTDVNFISRRVTLVGSEGGIQEVHHTHLTFDSARGTWSVDLPVDSPEEAQEPREGG